MPRSHSRTTRRRAILAASAIALTTAALGATGGVTHAATTAAATDSPVPTFGSPTVVDNYRPGFEPDVAVDRSPGDANTLYTSTPFGFSTTMSFIERSDDSGDSFHQIAAQVAGKPVTCVGGGDTEAQVDPVNGSLYFADLQGLTNYSASTSTNKGQSFSTSCSSVNGTAVDRQWIGDDTNGGTSSVGAATTAGRLYFDYDNVEQSTGTSSVGSNQLVINESLDGVNYGSNCAVAGAPCPGTPVVISASEGLPGNLIVDNTPGGKFEHSVYAVHTDRGQTSNILSYCRGADTGVPANAAAAASYCTDPTAIPADTSRVSTHWHDINIDIPNAGQVDKAFDVVTEDTAGNLYVSWASAPIDGSGNQTQPAQDYYSYSTDGGLTWAPRQQVNQPAQQTNIFPWITAGDPGKIDIAWYGTADTTGKAPYDSDDVNSGHWDVYLAQSLDALSSTPDFTVTKVSDHYVKYGNISTGGTTGTADRSLGDYMQVQTGIHGEALLSYVDDTSGGRNQDISDGSGETPPEAAGPTMIVRQIGGPSLFNAKGNLGDAQPAVDAVAAPTGNAFYAMAGMQTNTPTANDLTGVGVSRPDATHLQITLTTNDKNLSKDLSVSPTIGGPVGIWQVRWAARYQPTVNDGLIYYVGMQSVAGGAPTFYTGTTNCIATTRCKFFTYPNTTAVPGVITGDTIQWTVPLSAIGGPVNGNTLYSVTGTSVSQTVPTQPGTVELPTTGDPSNTQLPNTLDAAPSFSYTLRAATVGQPVVIPGQPAFGVVAGTKATASKKATSKKKATTKKKTTTKASGKPSTQKGTLAFTGLDTGIPVLALILAGLSLLVLRRRRAHRL